MTDTQIQELKERLEKDLADIEHRIGMDEQQDQSELSNYDNHPGDSDLDEVERGMAITEFKEEEADSIRAALQAIDEGTYGTCAVCGKEIPYERLDIVPTALTCVDHADQKPDMVTRPAEEDILRGSTEQPVKQEDEALRDFKDSFEDVEDYGSSDTPQDQPGEDPEDFYNGDDENN